ncbi:MAG: hypothetical protein HYY06_11285 [Deltaproteobacteria bacterium]|nr:hypothetical protein [Deltaproteobacteria bacterium]
MFLTPDDYEHDYVTVVAPRGTTVEIDGDEIGGFDTIGSLQGTAWDFTTVELDRDGTHVVSASAPVALLVDGYPAWLDLEELVF